MHRRKYLSHLNKICVIALMVFVCGTNAYAQSTTIKLPTADNSSNFNISDNADVNLLNLFGDGGFYVLGNTNAGALPISGAGTRLMWYPYKGAFRAGSVTGTEWDDSSIGSYSTALGYNTTASGLYSAALGYQTTASGDYAFASGYQSSASFYATAMGTSTAASGTYSTALGHTATASGLYSVALGYTTTASGGNSTAMGSYASTNSQSGSFIIGDASTTTVTNASAANQMTMRFAGGYRLFSNSSATIGVEVASGGNSWSSISDSSKKENFKAADGEYFLRSLEKLKLGSWNYKAQKSGNVRHYGPMAQEIFHYFGHDGIGTIGNDTTLASADMDGIIFIALKALSERTAQLQTLKKELAGKSRELEALKEVVAGQGRTIGALRENLRGIQDALVALLKRGGEKEKLSVKK